MACYGLHVEHKASMVLSWSWFMNILDRKCQDYVYVKWVLKYYVENEALFKTWK